MSRGSRSLEKGTGSQEVSRGWNQELKNRRSSRRELEPQAKDNGALRISVGEASRGGGGNQLPREQGRVWVT